MRDPIWHVNPVAARLVANCYTPFTLHTYFALATICVVNFALLYTRHAWLIKFLRPTQYKIFNFGNVLSSSQPSSGPVYWRNKTQHNKSQQHKNRNMRNRNTVYHVVTTHYVLSLFTMYRSALSLFDELACVIRKKTKKQQTIFWR